jgi:hypothetical protein
MIADRYNQANGGGRRERLTALYSFAARLSAHDGALLVRRQPS